MKDEQSNQDEDAILTDEEMTAAAILDGITRHKSSQQDGNPTLEELKRATEDF